MITTTIGKILTAVSVLKEISNYGFHAKTAFKFARIIQASEKELKNFEEARNAIFRKYGATDNNGNLIVKDGNVVIKKEFVNNYNQEVNELLVTEIELVANPIKIDELEELTFTPTQLSQLGNFIEE